ncbi:MAG: glucose 1-dehydrogenase [Vicinamibacterales bacterium]
MAERFLSRVVLVTGATGGLGLGIARAFSREGAAVVLAARRADVGERAAEELRSSGGEATFVQADVSAPDDARRLVAAAVSRYGRLDLAINNAGIGGTGRRTADYPIDTWRDVLSVNLDGLFYCMKWEIPELLKQPHAAIVNMASVSGFVAAPVGCAYTASKHGVIGLTRAAAMEYAPKGLRVNAVAPAVVRTAINEQTFFANAETEARIVAQHPLGRVGTIDEVAAAVLWLCSDEASFVTGSVLTVDGGFLAQ